MQESRKVKSLVIALIASITAGVAAIVDAPAELVMLASAFAAAVISARILRTRMHAEKRAEDSQPSAPEGAIDADEKERVRDSSMLQSKLQVESMRASALESELVEIRKRHDELMQERVELLRKVEANASKSPTTLTTSPVPAPEALTLRAPGEQREKLAAALAASENASRTLKEDLAKLNQRILAISHSIEKPAGTDAEATARNLQAASDAISSASTMIANAVQRMANVRDSKATAKITPRPDALAAAACERLASIKRQLNDATDIMRLTAMNFKLAAERNPAPAGAVDFHQAAASGIESLGESLRNTGADASTLDGELEQIVDMIEQMTSKPDEGQGGSGIDSGLMREMLATVATLLVSARNEIEIAMDGVRSKEKATFAREKLGHEAMAEAAARFAAATGWADSTATGIKTLLQDAGSTDEPR